MSILKSTYFIGLLIVGFAALFYFTADAQEGSDADVRWHACAQKTMKAFVNQGKDKAEKIMCNDLFQADPGPECEENVAILAQLGLLEAKLNNYFLTKIIMPKCGPHPEQ